MRLMLTCSLLLALTFAVGCGDGKTETTTEATATDTLPAKTLSVSDEHRKQATDAITHENASQKLDEIEKVLNQPLPKVGE